MNKQKRLFRIVFGVGILVIFAISRICYSASEESAESETMSEDSMLFQEIPSVFGASKYEQKVTEAPSSISIITADEIKKYGYRNFAEILRSIRGFHLTYDRIYHYLGTRGFGLPRDYNTRVLLLIDGHRTNDNVYDQAMLGTEFPLDIDLIDRVEIIRGSGSSLYGSNAFFAVINVITRKGRDVKGFETSGEAGSYETYKSRFSYGNRFQNGLEMLLSGSYYDSGGHDRLFFQEYDDPQTNNGVAEGLDYQRLGSFFAEISFRDFTLQGNYSQRKKGIPTASWGTVFNEDEYFFDENAWADLKFEHVYDEQLGVLARISYNHSYFDGKYPYESGNANSGIDTYRDLTTGRWLRSEIQATKTLFDVHKVTGGIDYQYNLRQDQLNENESVADGVTIDDRRDSQYAGIYLQDEFPLLDTLTLNTGVRFDYYDLFGGTINPHGALIYNPFEKTIFKFIYGRAFRSPNAFELYYNDGGFSQKPNPDLDTETIDSYEAVYEQYLGKSYRGTVVVFYNSMKDLISLTTDPGDGLLVFDNVDNVDAKGIELEMEGKWPGGHEGRISYTLQETENKETGKTVVNSPEHLLKLNLIGALLKEKVFLGVEEQYTGRRKTVSDNFAEDFFITNVTLYTRNIFKTLEISGSVYNVFDKRYDDPGDDAQLQDVIEQDGRTFRLKLTYAF